MSPSAAALSSPTTKPENDSSSRQLVRQIQACGKDVTKAVQLLENSVEEGPYLAALHVCGKAKRHDVALSLYHQKPTEPCRALAIAVCGRTGAYQQALELLRKPPSPPSIQSYNAAIAACGHAHAWKEALTILNDMPPSLVETFTCNAVLTALHKSKRGLEAKALLKRMKSSEWNNTKPDRNTYHYVIMALVKMSKLDSAHAVFTEMKQHPDTFPKDPTYELLITYYGKRKNWTMAHQLEQERRQIHGTKTDEDVAYFERWTMPSLKKVGRGKYARWEFGTLKTKTNATLTIAVHPHRNPAKNGISILLLKGNIKLGYLLMVNTATDNTSTLLGVYVDPKYRKGGLSKLFLGLWLKFCIKASITPQTGVMNKPLLALVLQYTFGMIPQEGMGVDAELSAGVTGDSIVLYSNTAKNIKGAFSPKDIKREGLIFRKEPSNPRGRVVRIGAPFSCPNYTTRLQESIHKVLEKDTVKYELTSHDLRRLFLGEK